MLPGMTPITTQPLNHQVSYVGSGGSVTTTSTWNHPGVSFGDAHPMRFMAVAFNGSNNRGVTNITLGGVNMTWITPDDSGAFPQIYLAHIPTGTSGNFSVSFDGDHTRLWFYFWRLQLTKVPTVLWQMSGPGSSPLNSTLQMIPGSVSIAMARNISNSAITIGGSGVNHDGNNQDGFLAVAAGSLRSGSNQPSHTMSATTGTPGTSFRMARVVLM